ncbi:MAG: cupin domain-containing protein [Symploca sp. SIO3C6]|uniref:Cupin domain-containing protein n=1 Tax=Symploca sp. SIO1C4 TaxID=2607765 RepID=A0A6B3NH47_9CYAN|nr:cupin domain-containing protein [Symploca sp. SIO3C6]NER30245.1 cupin domain-containing protein [Symploca sp. SIO1C4]NET05515.1 cupin domain-containing protein [Symploca sp. SIO2B6]
MVQSKEASQVSALTIPASMMTAENIDTTGMRPWGSYTILEEGRGYKIKRIEVKPGHRLSLQMHHHRSEHWIVVSGTAKVTCGDKISIIHQNQSTYVPQCHAHRLENPGIIPLVLIEVQNGEYLGEDDIIRFEDDYDRSQPQGK